MEQKVAAYFKELPSPQREICAALRQSILGAFPELEERWAWSRPVYYVGKDLICHLVANKNHVNLGLYHGSQLDDPKGLVAGTGKSMRHIKIHELSEADLSYYEDLIAQSIKQIGGE